MQAMVARVLEQKKAVRQVLSNIRKTAHLIITWQDTYSSVGVYKQRSCSTSRPH